MDKYKLLALVVTGLLTSSCSNNAVNEISYCDPESGNWKGTWRIDLEKARVYGQDVSSFIGTIEHGKFVGFDMPFPVLLFDDSVDRNELARGIDGRNYKFRFFPPQSSGSDLWIIVATVSPQTDKGTEELPRTNATVLYSLQDGVLSISLSSSLKPVINLVPCTNRTLKYRDIKSMVTAENGAKRGRSEASPISRTPQ